MSMNKSYRSKILDLKNREDSMKLEEHSYISKVIQHRLVVEGLLS